MIENDHLGDSGVLRRTDVQQPVQKPSSESSDSSNSEDDFHTGCQNISHPDAHFQSTMEDKTLKTINMICLNFSPFLPPPSNVVVCAGLYTLPCPKRVSLFGGGKGRAIHGIHVVREVHIMLHLNI